MPAEEGWDDVQGDTFAPDHSSQEDDPCDVEHDFRKVVSLVNRRTGAKKYILQCSRCGQMAGIPQP